MAVAELHPSFADLEAFTLGTLNDDSLSHVEAHLAGCQECQAKAATASGDTLVELLRRVHLRTARQCDTVAEAAVQTPALVPAFTEGVTQPPAAPTEAGGTEASDAIPPELSRHERYRVQCLLGAGGMGSVYKAEHCVMQRAVALKVINRAYTTNPAAVERFRREVRAAARLSHPNIVTTYDAEDAGNSLFLVMEYADGVSLARLVKEGGPLPVAEACTYIRQAALGLQHAHERGMVHRDVKPDNLIRCADGTVKVLDFGLAALTAERGSGLTDLNAIMGTPDYMAPEQAEDARTADIRSDVYSLGCTLYYLLTGNVPYPATTPLLKILAHREQPLPSLRKVCPEAPPELARVVARMLAKKPEDRYQTPGEVADALAPFASNASPTPPKQRRRLLVAALAALLLVGIGLAGAVVYRIQTDTGELVITTESDDVEVVIKQGGKLVRIIDTKTDKEIKLTLRSGVYELELKGAPEGLKLSIENATLTRGETVLAKIERKRPVPELPQERSVLFNGKDLTGWVVDGSSDKVWRVENGELVGKHVDQRGYDPCWLLTEHSYSDFRLQFEFKLSSGTNSGVTLRAVPGEKGRVDKTKPLHLEVQILDDAKYRQADGKVDYPTGSLFWNSGASYLRPDSPADLKPIGDWNEMVIESRGDTLQVWVNGRRIQNADLHKLAAQSDALPALNRTSGRIGLQQHTGEVRFRNIEIRGLPDPLAPEKVGEVWRVPTPGFDCFHNRFSPDGRRFLLGGQDAEDIGWVLIGDTATGKTLKMLGPGHRAGLFTPDNKMVLTFHGTGALKLWDAADGREIRRFEGHPNGFAWADISPDGSRIVSGGADGKVRIWDLETGKALFVVDAYAGSCGAIFTPDGREAVSFSHGDPVIRIWDTQTGKLVQALDGNEKGWGVLGVLSRDRIVTFRMKSGVAVRDRGTGKELLRLPLGNNVQGFAPHALTPDGRLLTAHMDRSLHLWNLDNGKEVGRINLENVPDRGAFHGVAVSSDGRYALAASFRAFVHLVRLPDAPPPEKVGEVRRFEGHTEEVWGVAFSPDDRYALSTSSDKTIRLWDLQSGKQIRRFLGHTTHVHAVAFTPDGREFLSCGQDRTIRLWDVETGKELNRAAVGGKSLLTDVTLSPDGTLALVTCADKILYLWDVKNWKELRRFEGHTDTVQKAVFSADGSRALSASWDKTMRLWDVESGKELKCFEGHEGLVLGVALSLDGRLALSGAEGHKPLRLWDVETGKELRRFEGHTDAVCGVAFSPDGRLALSASRDCSIRLWEVRTGKELYRFDGHEAQVSSVVFSRDGRYALSGSKDKTVRLWRLPDAPTSKDKP